jgi:ABC-type lipoprotein release transport system permease subunit
MWQLRLSYSYWRHHLWWLIGSALGVAVTVGLAFVVTHLWLETEHTYNDLVEQPLGAADAYILANDDEGMYAVWQTVLEKLPGIEVVAPVLNRQTVAIKNGSSLSVQVRGINPELNVRLHATRLLEGRMITRDDQIALVISSTVAKELSLNVNEMLELVTPQGTREYTVVGISNEGSSVVVAPLPEIQTLFTSGDYVDGFDVRFAAANQSLTLQTLREHLKSVATVLTTNERTKSVRNMFSAILFVLLTVFVFSLIMMTCLLIGLLETSQTERQDETRALYMLGVSYGSLLRWRRLELGTLLIIASIVGILVAAMLLPVNLIALLAASLLTIFIVSATLFLFTLEPVIATHQPESRFGRVRFTHRNRVHRSERRLLQNSQWCAQRTLHAHGEEFRYKPEKQTIINTARDFLASKFRLQHFAKPLAPRTFELRTLPPNVWLSWQLLTHLGKRYWLAVVSLMLALTGFTSLGIILQVQRGSLETFLSKRPVLTERTLQIQEEYPASLSNSTRWNMAMMPGVVFVSSYLTKVTMEEKLEEDLYVLDGGSFPYQSYLQTSDGLSIEAFTQALQTERDLAISDSLAESYKLKVGMNVRLQTPTGNHRYKIVATLKDISGISRAMFMGRDSYLKDWGRADEGLFVLSFEETLQPQQVEQLLREQLAHSSSLPWSMVSFKSELEQLLGKLLAWCRWLMLLFVVVAVSMLAHALSSPSLGHLLSTLYLLGGQQRLLRKLAQNTVLVTTFVFTMLALAFGTTLSYILVDGLTQSGNIWAWQLSSSSYTPSLAVFFLLLSFLAVMMNKVFRLK